MMPSIRLVLFALLTLCCVKAKAQQQIRPDLLQPPEGFILTPTTDTGAPTIFKPKAEYKVFDYDQWVVMAHILTDYDWLWHYSAQLELKVLLLDETTEAQKRQISFFQMQLNNTQSGLNKMSGLLDSEQKARAKDSSRSELKVWFWCAATIVAIAGAGVFGGLYISEKVR